MREQEFSTLYKTQFHIDSDTFKGVELLDIVVNKIRGSWNNMLVKHYDNNQISRDFELPTDFNFNNMKLNINMQENSIGSDKRIILSQKNISEQGIFRQEIYLVLMDDRLEFTLTLSTNLPIDSVTPNPPTILRSLMFENDDFFVTMYGQKIEHWKFVSGENFEHFQQIHLDNPERRWPLVVFTTLFHDGDVYDYWNIAKKLHGFAIPVKMAPGATYKLRQLFGDAPHRGGITVFHPKNTGLKPTHFKPVIIKEIGFDKLALMLDRQCLNSTLKSINPQKSKAYLFHKAWEAVQSTKSEFNRNFKDEQNELIALRIEVSNLYQTIEDLENYLDYAEAHTLNLTNQIDDLNLELKILNPPESSDLEKGSKSVVDVLDGLIETFGGNVRIFDEASKSAKKSGFTKLSRLEDTLHTMISIIIPMLQRGNKLLDIKKNINKQISSVAWNENPSTMKNSKFAELRKFSNKDKRGNKYSTKMESHITFPGKKGGSPLSVYFAISEHPREVQIGYCGDHLAGISSKKNH